MNEVTQKCYYSLYGLGNMKQVFFCNCIVSWICNIKVVGNYIITIFTLIHVLEFRISYRHFFCLRKIMVSICKKDINQFHWSRIVLRDPAQKKSFGQSKLSRESACSPQFASLKRLLSLFT